MNLHNKLSDILNLSNSDHEEDLFRVNAQKQTRSFNPIHKEVLSKGKGKGKEKINLHNDYPYSTSSDFIMDLELAKKNSIDDISGNLHKSETQREIEVAVALNKINNLTFKDKNDVEPKKTITESIITLKEKEEEKIKLEKGKNKKKNVRYSNQKTLIKKLNF